MNTQIRISEKHGLNPSQNVCIICNEVKEIVLFGALKGDAEAPKTVCLDIEPCENCKKQYLERGVLMVEADEDKTPTGKIAVITNEAFMEMFNYKELPPKKIVMVEIGLLEKIGAINGSDRG